jgi:phosphate transport system protein
MTTRSSAPVTPHFLEDLAALKQELAHEGEVVAARLSSAIKGLVVHDLDRLDEVAIGDGDVNAMQMAIDDRAFKLLALHQPVAIDLRMIVAAIKINADLERIGDLAVNIAEAAKRYISHAPVKQLIDIPQMGDIAQAMLRDALDAYVKQDSELATKVLNEDDRLDSLKAQVFRDLLTHMLQNQSTVEPSLDLILVSRHLERIGDHATNIAEDVIFMVSALDVRHHLAGSN